MNSPHGTQMHSDSRSFGVSSLPTEDREAQIFWRLRWRIARTQLRQLFTTARLRTGLVVSLSLLFWVGLFALFYPDLVQVAASLLRRESTVSLASGDLVHESVLRLIRCLPEWVRERTEQRDGRIREHRERGKAQHTEREVEDGRQP